MITNILNSSSNSSDSISDISLSSTSDTDSDHGLDWLQLIKKTYPTVPDVEMEKLQISEVGKYSTSQVSGAKQLVYYINRYCNIFNVDKCKDLVITDGTGNNGSDTIYLALNFKQINSIEKDPSEFKILSNNIATYKLKNVELFNGSTLDIIQTLKQDIIYIDAPWGGISYKNYKQVRLYMDNKEISQIYKDNKQHAKLFIFKVPRNYDFNNFIAMTKTNFFEIHAVLSQDNTRIKYYFIFVANIQNVVQ